MADPRFAIPLEQFVAGARVAREDHVEVQPVDPTPQRVSADGLPYGDGMGGDVDGD